MDIFEGLMGRRSCRRFKQDPISREDFDKMIDAGRYVPTGFNKQPVRFAIISSPEKVAEAFAFTGWLTGKPEEGERPAGYIVVLNVSERFGAGPPCATLAVMLAAHALGYESCWHGQGGNEDFKKFLGLGDDASPYVLISLGKPGEEVEVHDGSEDWKVRKDDDGLIHLGKYSREFVTLGVL